MQLTQELPDYTYALKSADGRSARVNDLVLEHSFILMPDQLVREWPAGSDAAALQPGQMIPVLELQPALVLLGTGTRQVFPSVEVMAAFLTRGIGIEVMDNAAAARTYNVLASEGRRVAAAFLLGS